MNNRKLNYGKKFLEKISRRGAKTQSNLLLKSFLLFTFYFLLFTSANAQFTDDFSDGDFTNGNVWSGDAAKFAVNNFQLQSNSSVVGDTFYLSTPSTLAQNCQWEFWMNLQLNTSSLNYVDIVLTSDNANLKATNINDYFLRIGGTQDNISLYRNVNGTPTLLVACDTGFTNHSSNIFKIKVTRNAANLFTIFTDISGTGNSYTPVGTITDNTFLTSSYFGVLVKQSTASFFQKHFFDDFYVGNIIVDVTPPTVLSATATSATTLDVLFSEGVEQISAQDINNYSVNNGIGVPTTAVRDGSNLALVHLTFTNSFVNGTNYLLSVSGVNDFSANTMTFGSANFSFYTPQKNDVVINEILADESPIVGLPNCEWIELFNTSTHTINLNGWTFSDASTSQTFSSFSLLPDSFVVVCASSNVALFTMTNNVIGVSSLPSLNNTGDDLTLRDNFGQVINHVSYNMNFYHDAVKENGGWSMEMIDAHNPCGGENNWHASLNSIGGTPGKINSVAASNPDVVPPIISNVYVLSADSVKLTFNEPMDSLSLSNVNNYNETTLGNPTSVMPLSPDFSSVVLYYSNPVQPNILYIITVNNVTDCSGNIISSTGNSIDFAVPTAATAGDVLINEVLYNPKSGGSDYVELYNNSTKAIDLSSLYLTNHTTLVQLPQLLMLSHSFFVFTTDKSTVLQNYTVENPSHLIEVSSIPSMNDDEGSVILLDGGLFIIDSLHYNSSWQFPLINDLNGVALERISYNQPTQDSLNWHSAAAQFGYGTPTFENSQSYIFPNTTNYFHVEPQIFSPDNNGHDDVVGIGYQYTKPGYVANVKIFDSQGRLVKNLIQNELLAQEGTFFWDGVNENNEKSPIGIYIIYIEAFDLNGVVKTEKLTCVLAAKTN